MLNIALMFLDLGMNSDVSVCVVRVIASLVSHQNKTERVVEMRRCGICSICESAIFFSKSFH